MGTFTAIAIFSIIFLLIPQGRQVFLIFLGVFYIPLQFLFMWLQKINLGLKDKDPLAYYLSCIIIYPLYAIIIGISKLYETFQASLH